MDAEVISHVLGKRTWITFATQIRLLQARGKKKSFDCYPRRTAPSLEALEINSARGYSRELLLERNNEAGNATDFIASRRADDRHCFDERT